MPGSGIPPQVAAAYMKKWGRLRQEAASHSNYELRSDPQQLDFTAVLRCRDLLNFSFRQEKDGGGIRR